MTSEPKTCGTCHHWQRDPGCDHMGVCWRTCFRDDYGSEVYAEIGDYYRACAIRELAAALGVSPSTAEGHVRRLERRGLVEVDRRRPRGVRPL